MPDAVKTIEAPPTAMAAAAPEDRVAIDAAPEQAIPIPRVTHYVAPRYPGGSEARASGGQVDLQFTIDADGEARDITVLAGAEHPQLADAAVTALRQWRFAPGSAATGHLYRQAIDFDPPSAGSSCRIPIGSHICRSDLAGDATGAAVTALH
ncbi:MAG: TonB family protein [Proteobacteria bacterium]|nr:TonB family protein [Pseudomonadota bacterium]